MRGSRMTTAGHASSVPSMVQGKNLSKRCILKYPVAQDSISFISFSSIAVAVAAVHHQRDDQDGRRFGADEPASSKYSSEINTPNGYSKALQFV